MEDAKPQTLQQKENVKRKLLRKLVITARQIISYEVGISVGDGILNQNVRWLRNEGVVIDLPVIAEYENAIRPIPWGKERLNCSREALRRYDATLLEINGKFHDRIIDACFQILEYYGNVDLTPLHPEN